MPLQPGTRVGPYEITGQLGAGGMGEVCRARDTKLGRDVALKVLPEAFATDADRMSRFQREAQLLAALNHPNIAAIYGLEDGGSRQAIVMELVEGQTLIGPLPIDDALRVAKQIAEAVEYAHERGIIHRDLKPANIKVTPDGTVKVLDFGLAKAMDDVSDSVMQMTGSMSPTLSLGATYAGVILGTAAYMAPEQAKGRPADRRSDIWAFGIVLYEMLTGDRMFGGDSVAETLASVMKDQITFGKLPGETPAPVRKLVSRCLERDPKRRLQSIGEARIVLDDAITGVTADDIGPQPAPAASGSRWPWIVAAAAILISAATIGWVWSRPAPPPPLTQRFSVPPPEGGIITSYRSFASNLAVSPDGRYVTFVVDEPGRERSLWVRALDSQTGQRLDRTGDAIYPFWSPDSRNIGYFAKSKLMRISVAGGAPQTIADATDGEGGSWFQPAGQDDIIIFADTQTGPLKRVLAKGGVATTVTKLADGEAGHTFPQFLPDGRFLYLARGNNPAIYVQALNSSERTLVLNASSRAAYSPPGFLLYLRDNTLLAHHWNLSTLKLEGEPVAIAEDVRSGGNNGRNAFAVSNNGLLAYRSGGTGGNAQVTWYTRDGKADGVMVERGENGPLLFAPDDKHLVVIRGQGDDRDLWIADLATGVLSPLTTTPGAERSPVWSPDSRTVAYLREEGGKSTVYVTTIGSGKQTAVPADGRLLDLMDWTGDGRFLLIRPASTRGIVQLLPMPQPDTSASVAGNPRTVFDEAYAASQFRVSPDVKWVAYTSQQSGQSEIWIATFPAFADRRQISIGGGVQPIWRGDGRELFYLGRDQRLKAVELKFGTTLEVGAIQTLFLSQVPQATNTYLYGVTHDGKRFAIREPISGGSNALEQLNIVTNWTSLVSH